MLRSEYDSSVSERAVEGRVRPPTGPPPRIGDLVDDHGADLFSLASMILGDRAEAEAVVTRVLLTTQAQDLPSWDANRRRRQLARNVYLCCARKRMDSSRARHDLVREQHPHGSGGAALTMARLRVLSEQQRGAIALSMYGDHTYVDIADLMALPAPVIAALLRSGLRELLA